MKKLLVFSLLLSFISVVSAQSKSDKDPYMTKALDKESIKNILVETSGGSILVDGVNQAQARIEVYIHASNSRDDKSMSKDEIKQRLDELYDLVVDVKGEKLIATAKQKSNKMDWKRSLSISFRIYVPGKVSTDLSTSGGSIQLSNLNGNIGFTTSGGSLSLDKLGGKINGRTSGGSIEVTNSTDDIDLTTSGGSVDAANCTGKLRLSTSGGSLHLSDLKGDIRATTSGGSIDGKNIEGELVSHTSGGGIHFSDLSCSLETSTSGGNIDVTMKELGQYVKISNSGGNINLQLPKSKAADLDLEGEKVKTDHMDNFEGKVEPDNIKGKLNGGGVSVRVTSNGRVNLEFR